MTGGVAAAGVVTTGAGGTGPALACRLEAPIARGAGCEQAAWTPLPEKPPAPTDCGDARSPAPSTLPKLPPRAPGPVSAARSFSLIRRGGGASSTLKPLARAHVRGSSPISSASRISCMAVMTLSTASRDAFAASALHLVWIAWISANCSGNGFFDARTFDFLISFPCNAGQPAPQIVDGVSGGIEGALLYFVLLCLSDLGFRSPKVPANQVFGRSTLIPQQKIMLADQIPCELLLLHGPSGPVLRGGTQGRRRGRPPRPHQHRAPPTGRKISRHHIPAS